MPRPRIVITLVALLVLTACIPGTGPFLRNVDGQRWAARFEVAIGPAGAPALRLPVDLTLTFSQRMTDVSADATLVYDAALFSLRSPRLVTLTGRLGLDDALDLEGPNRVLAFDGRFVADRLVGTVSIAGVAPVADVVFTRVR